MGCGYSAYQQMHRLLFGRTGSSLPCSQSTPLNSYLQTAEPSLHPLWNPTFLRCITSMLRCIYVLFSTDFLVANYDDKPDSVRQYTDFSTVLLTFKLPLQSTRVKVISFTPIRKSKAFYAPISTNSCQSPAHNFTQIGRKVLNTWQIFIYVKVSGLSLHRTARNPQLLVNCCRHLLHHVLSKSDNKGRT